jgi:hypothetical protein
MAKDAKKQVVVAPTLSPPTQSEVAKPSAAKAKGKKVTKADIQRSGFTHGMVLVNPNTGDQEVHVISNARDLATLAKWRVVTEFGSAQLVKMSDVLSKISNIPNSSDED